MGFSRYISPLLTRDTRRLILTWLTRQERGLLMLAHGIDVKASLLTHDFSIWCGENNHVTLLAWAKDNKCPLSRIITRGAIKFGHWEATKWCIEHELEEGDCAAAAAYHGQMRILELLHAKKYPFELCLRPAITGQMDMGPCCKSAIMGGHLHILQWLIANGYSHDDMEAELLAKMMYHNHIVEWIQSKRQRIED